MGIRIYVDVIGNLDDPAIRNSLAGIKEEKIDTFINCMKEARDTEVFKECRTWLLDHVDQFEHVTKEDIEANSVRDL